MRAARGPLAFAALHADRLQGPRLGYLPGLQNIGFAIGATFGPLLAGTLFDLQGGCAMAFVLMVVSILVSSAVVSTVARRPASLPR